VTEATTHDRQERLTLEKLLAVIEEAKAAWQETGRPFPMTSDDWIVEARIAGFSADKAQEGNFTGHDVYLQAKAAQAIRQREQQDREHLAAEIAKRMIEARPAVADEDPSRIANEISCEFRRMLAALDEAKATSLANKMTRDEVESRTKLAHHVVRNVMEKQRWKTPVPLVDTKTGPGGGLWLTAEGTAVASLIDKKILP
jgi:cytidylate kinase